MSNSIITTRSKVTMFSQFLSLARNFDVADVAGNERAAAWLLRHPRITQNMQNGYFCHGFLSVRFLELWDQILFFTFSLLPTLVLFISSLVNFSLLLNLLISVMPSACLHSFHMWHSITLDFIIMNFPKTLNRAISPWGPHSHSCYPLYLLLLLCQLPR